MPKQVWKIERFDGGMNTASDPRDIADNELVEARDIMVDHVGKIRALGAGEAVGYSTADHGHVEPGYGLFICLMIWLGLKINYKYLEFMMDQRIPLL